MPDFLLNGQAQGSVAARLLQNDCDPHALRPWVGRNGRSYISMRTGEMKTNEKTGESQPVYKAVPTQNAATLRKDEWILLDQVVQRVATPRMRLVNDLRSSGLQFVIPNGYAYSVLQYEDMSDISRADISMDGLRRSESDRPVFDIKNLPLPVIHKDFQFPARQLAQSRKGGTPIDTTTAELAVRRVAEEAESLLAGTSDEYSFGGGTIYGYANFPSRLTQEISDPSESGHKHSTTVNEVLNMISTAQDNNHFGPFWLYYGRGWTVPMGEDYSVDGGNNPNQTLRQRLAAIDPIEQIRLGDFLPENDLILVEKNSSVVRAVIGMDVRLVQWEEQGGGLLNFKAMAIIVPQLRTDQLGQTGIVHGSFAT